MSDLISRLRERLAFRAKPIPFKHFPVRVIQHEEHRSEIYDLMNDYIDEALRYQQNSEVIEAMVECVSEASNALWICECRCDKMWTGREMHEPNALCGELDDLKAALANLERLVEGEK